MAASQAPRYRRLGDFLSAARAAVWVQPPAMMTGLQKLGRPVEYLLFADEGHSISKWRNRLAMWRTIEDKLAVCLGERSAGFDYYQLMPR